MTNYTWVEEVRINTLSNRALLLLARFARTLKQIDGEVLNLQDPMIAGRAMREVRRTRNPELKAHFDQFLIELHLLIETGSAARCPELSGDRDLVELNQQRVDVARSSVIGDQSRSLETPSSAH